MDEVLEFVRVTVPHFEEDLLRTKLEEIGVEQVNDMQELDCVQDLVPPLKLIQARKVQKSIAAHFTTQEPIPTLETQLCPPSNSIPSSPSPSPSTSTLIKPTNTSPRSFHIPYDKFSPSLKKKFEKKKIASKTEIAEMVKILSNEIFHTMSYPGRDMIKTVAGKIVQQYPESFTITLLDDDSVLGNGVDLLERKLVTRLISLKRCANEQQIDEEGVEAVTKRRKTSKKDKYGTVRYLPESFPDHETCETQLLKKQWLQDEFLKTRREQDFDQITTYMNITYTLQRQDITEKGVSTSVLRQEWPFLFQKCFLAAHFKQLMGIDLFQHAKDTFSTLVPILTSYLRTKVSIEGEVSENMSKSRKVLRDNLIKIREGNQECIGQLLVTMMDWWGQPKDLFFKTYNDTTSITEVENNADAMPHPHVAVLGDSVFNGEDCFVPVFEGNAIAELQSAHDAVLLAFAQYYVYSIAYPHELGASMEFIQRLIFNIDGEGSKVGRKKNKSNPPSKNSRVVTLMADLAHHKRLWKM